MDVFAEGCVDGWYSLLLSCRKKLQEEAAQKIKQSNGGRDSGWLGGERVAADTLTYVLQQQWLPGHLLSAHRP